jgi:hypothetical protein
MGMTYVPTHEEIEDWTLEWHQTVAWFENPDRKVPWFFDALTAGRWAQITAWTRFERALDGRILTARGRGEKPGPLPEHRRSWSGDMINAADEVVMWTRILGPADPGNCVSINFLATRYEWWIRLHEIAGVEPIEFDRAETQRLFETYMANQTADL